jgi:LmbE family N-acetylglucosaminyl deacetylase
LADEKPAKRLKVVCVGAHPDDPESGCGGTLAHYANAGHAVTIVYLTRGERGIPGKGLEESAKIRTIEAEKACKILGATPLFAGQVDGATEFTQVRLAEISRILDAEKPELVFTHWPLDTHQDHQMAGLLTLRWYFNAKVKPLLYFFEVNTGEQALGFMPTVYVDISSTRAKKKAALFAHQSQNGESIWKEHHEIMENWRGREAGVKAAEAFVHLNGNITALPLPGT